MGRRTQRSQEEKCAAHVVDARMLRKICDYRELTLTQITDRCVEHAFGVGAYVDFWMWLAFCVRIEKLLLDMHKDRQIRVKGGPKFEEKTSFTEQRFVTRSWR